VLKFAINATFSAFSGTIASIDS